MHLLKMPEICKQSDLVDIDVLFEIKRTDNEHMVWHGAWMHASSSRGEEERWPSRLFDSSPMLLLQIISIYESQTFIDKVSMNYDSCGTFCK